MTATLDGQVALITGGGSGIGLGCARALVADGATVVLAGRNPDRLDEGAATLRDELVAPTSSGTGTIHAGLVHTPTIHAGLGSHQGLRRHGRGQRGDRVRNRRGAGAVHDGRRQRGVRRRRADPPHVARGVELDPRHQPHRRSSRSSTRSPTSPRARGPVAPSGSAIVAVSSVAAARTHRYMTPYDVSKAGLDMLIRQTADECGGAGIRANSVRPGLVPTDASQTLMTVPQIHDDYLTQMPLGRVGTTEEVGRLVRFLLGPESSWITGTCISVDGGHHLRRGPDLTPVMQMLLGDALSP